MTCEELQRLIDQSLVHRDLSIGVAGATDASVELRCRAEPRHAGEDGSEFLHGGIIALLLDTAASFSLIQATGSDWATVDLRIDYLTPGRLGALIVKGTAVHVGRRIGRAAAEVADGTRGSPIAVATGTFIRLARVFEASS